MLINNVMKYFLCLVLLEPVAHAADSYEEYKKEYKRTEKNEIIVKNNGDKVRRKEVTVERRTHSKIKLYELIVHALEYESDPAALKWIDKSAGIFALNGPKFTDYYQLKTESSAKWNSIRNRLTKSKSGFYALDTTAEQMPPRGYHKFYTHKDWPAKLPAGDSLPMGNSNPISSANSESNQNKRVYDNSDTDQTLSKYSKTESAPNSNDIVTPLVPLKPTEDELSAARVDSLLFEQVSAYLQPETVPFIILRACNENIDEDCFFNVKDFFEKLYKVYARVYSVIPEDLINWQTLMNGEKHDVEEGCKATIALASFGWRFGPWGSGLVLNIRKFIKAGGLNWYHGECTEEEAISILAGHDGDIFVFCGVPMVLKTEQQPATSIEKLKFKQVFAIIFRENGSIKRINIFKDFLSQLRVLKNQSNTVSTSTNVTEDDFDVFESLGEIFARFAPGRTAVQNQKFLEYRKNKFGS